MKICKHYFLQIQSRSPTWGVAPPASRTLDSDAGASQSYRIRITRLTRPDLRGLLRRAPYGVYFYAMRI